MKLPEPPWIVAHRGAEPLLENTVPALLQGIAEGADLLEFDVRSTHDEVLVLFHDADLGRLAHRPDLRVERTTAATLAGIELAHPTKRDVRGRIPTLAELFTALPDDFPVNVELKRDARNARSDAGRLAGLALVAAGDRPNVLFSSFDLVLLRELRRRSARAHLAVLAHTHSPRLEAVGGELGATSLHVARLPRGEHSRAALRAGLPVLVYTVNRTARARDLFARGVAGVFSDRPGALRAELGQPGDRGVLSRTYRGTGAPEPSA
ncbi:MAG: glycerophosphodiester phosphodiesterase family protein [Thermoanaerobaculia bacterium]